MNNIIEFGIIVIIVAQLGITLFSMLSDPGKEIDQQKKITRSDKATIVFAVTIAIVALGMQYYQIKDKHSRESVSQGGLIYSAHLLMLETAAAFGVVINPKVTESDIRRIRRLIDERRQILGLTLLSSQPSLDPETIRATRSLDEVMRKWIRAIDEMKETDESLFEAMYDKSKTYKEDLCDKFSSGGDDLKWLEKYSKESTSDDLKIDSFEFLCRIDREPVRAVLLGFCNKEKRNDIFCTGPSLLELANKYISSQKIGIN